MKFDQFVFRLVLSTLSLAIEQPFFYTTFVMTLANRFRIAFLLIAAALPYASAEVNARGESSCKGDDFW
jgi:hypothetical protein